ncbi:MAG: hypothetical protein HGA45_33570 [Chloroflexales bacterium]|nr:hypothetical protein [Chloroflexales bacterium]
MLSKLSLTTLATQGRRLNRLVANLLDGTRLSADRLTLQLGSVDLRALVAQLVEELRLSTTRHGRVLDLPDTPLLLIIVTLPLAPLTARA